METRKRKEPSTTGYEGTTSSTPEKKQKTCRVRMGRMKSIPVRSQDEVLRKVLGRETKDLEGNKVTLSRAASIVSKDLSTYEQWAAQYKAEFHAWDASEKKTGQKEKSEKLKTLYPKQFKNWGVAPRVSL